MRLNKLICFCLLLASSALFCIKETYACSRVLWNDNSQAVLVGRNMDWPVDMGAAMFISPRGIKRSGLTGKNSLSWKSKYGNIAVASYFFDRGVVTDGMNEKGLAANLLWMDESDYGKRNEKIPGLAISLWAQYFLDNFATVNEALRAIRNKPFQLVTLNILEGQTTGIHTIHLSLADKSGDSAMIEYIAGRPVIHHSRGYAVVTNEPAFEKQLGYLRQYQGFGGDKPLPGTSSPQDRFVRASYYLMYMPKPHNLREALAGIFNVIRNISQPFQTPYDDKSPGTSATVWNTIADLTNGTYYFVSTNSPHLVWISLNDFKLSEGSPIMKLDLGKGRDFSGNIGKKFRKSAPFKFLTP